MVGRGFLFHLPLEFFDSTECLGAGKEAQPGQAEGESDATQQDAAAPTASTAAAETGAAWSESGATCIACGIGINSQGFASSTEQRLHFKTDWHRYNLKRRLDKKPPVSEADFEKMVEDDDDLSSISGSDTDSSEESSDDGDDNDYEQRRLHKAAAGHAASLQGAQAVFQAPDGSAFAVWRCLLMPDSHKHRHEEPRPGQLLELLRQLRQLPESSSGAADALPAAAVGSSSSSRAAGGTAAPAASGAGGCVWTLLMLRGGHFAGAVVRINSSSNSSSSSSRGAAGRQQLPAASAGGGAQGSDSPGQQQQQQQLPRVAPSTPAEPFQVLAHKTFHRYVVRAKAGGKQSTKDASGKYARSAGSRLRRYNEAALQRDITSLLREWSQLLAASQLIFLAAPGSNSRDLFAAAADVGSGVLPGGAGAAVAAAGKGGHSVLEPSDARLRRVPFVTQRPTFSELKRVLMVLGSIRPMQLEATDEAEGQQGADDNEAAAAAAAGSKQLDAKQQAAAAAVASIPGPSPTASKKLEEPPLIKAAKAGDAERVSRLLVHGHDPTVRDARGRSPYQLAANKEVRDALRRFMASAPDAWDYSSSDIPSPLTDELEAAQQSKKADKRARQKGKDKGKAEGKAAADGSSSQAAAAAAAGGDFDAELAAAMAEAAAISSRAAATARSKQVGGSSSSGGKKGASAAAAKPSAEEVARRREQLAAAAEARLKALQKTQQLW